MPANDVGDRLAVICHQRLEPERGRDRLGVVVVQPNVFDEPLDDAGAVREVIERPDPLRGMMRGLLCLRLRLLQHRGKGSYPVGVVEGDRALDPPSCGLLVDPSGPGRLVAGLESAFRRLLNDRDLVTSLSEGALRRADEISAERQIPAVLQTYERVLASGGAKVTASR